MLKNCCFFILLFLTLIKNISLYEAVIFAFQIFKHGASAPISGVKNGVDLFNENWLENGEITNIGKRQLYLLGVKSRERYITKFKLINAKYNPNELFIKSTDTNRTIESTYSFIHGLFPNGIGQTINRININKTNIIYPPNSKHYKKFDEILNHYSLSVKNYALPYQMNIIPIHIFYIPDIEIQLYDFKICKGHENEYKELNKKKELDKFAQNITNKNEEIFINLERKYSSKKNINKKFMEDYNTLFRYTDNIICDNMDLRNYSSFNREFPENSIDFQNLYNYSKSFRIKDYNINNNHTNISIVEGSLTMRSIAYWMKTARTQYDKGKTLYNKRFFRYIVYSVDENTLGGFEGFVNKIFNTSIEYAEFAESRAFELYYDSQLNDYFVRYIKGNNKIKMNMTYNDFRNVVYNKTWTFWNVTKYCQFDQQKIENYDINLSGAGIMVVLSVLDGVLIVLLILFCARKNKQ